MEGLFLIERILGYNNSDQVFSGGIVFQFLNIPFKKRTIILCSSGLTSKVVKGRP